MNYSGAPGILQLHAGDVSGGNMSFHVNGITALNILQSGATANTMTLSAGQVGIGTAAPAVPLHVVGNLLVGTNTTDAATGYNSLAYPLTVTYLGSSHQGAGFYDKVTDTSTRTAVWFKRYVSSTWTT